jgi:hypothetical protein
MFIPILAARNAVQVED